MKRTLLSLVFSFYALSCAGNRTRYITQGLKNNPTTQSVQTTQPVIALETITGNKLSSKIPDEIPASVLTSKAIYDVRLRVVIDHSCLLSVITCTPITVIFHSADSINHSIEVANKMYEPIGLRFNVVKCEFVDAKPDYRDYWVDAFLHPNELSVYFMSPNNFEYSGMSVFPWEPYPEGIVMACYASEYTLSHEIGHYFGLMHTFDPDGDQCDDTPKQMDECNNTLTRNRVNCGNLMNYCQHTPKKLTACQKLRVLRYLRAARMNVVMPVGEKVNNEQVLKEKFEEFNKKNF